MSPRLRSELRLRVGPRRCSAEVWRAGWRGGLAAALSAEGEDAATALEAALWALRDAGQALPRRAVLCLEDECLYHQLLPAGGRWREAPARARALFADALGDAALQVALRLAPGGRSWLAVAVEAALVEALREALRGHGVALRALRTALGEDLWRRRAELPARDGLLVLLRQQGAMLLGLRGGALEALSWERGAVDAPETLRARLQAFAARWSLDGAVPCLVPADAGQHARLCALAAAEGWQLLEALAAPETPAPLAGLPA